GSGYRFATPDAPDTGAAARPTSDSAQTLGLMAIALQASELPSRPFPPTEAVNQLHRGLNRLIDGATRQGANLLQRIPRELQKPGSDKPAPEKPAANFLEASMSLEDVDLKQVVEGLGVSLPFSLEGRLTTNVKVGIPLQKND